MSDRIDPDKLPAAMVEAAQDMEGPPGGPSGSWMRAKLAAALEALLDDDEAMAIGVAHFHRRRLSRDSPVDCMRAALRAAVQVPGERR